MKIVDQSKLILSGIIAAFIVLQIFIPQAVYADDIAPGVEPQPEEQVAVEPEVPDDDVVLPEIGALPVDVDLVVVDQSGEQLALASESAAQILRAPDPYFTSGGILYTFTSVDCDPMTPGDQACSNPIQQAINFSKENAPDDGTIYVESGVYEENLEIGDFVNFQLMGVSGSSSTVLNGNMEIYRNNNFTLLGFTVNGRVFAMENKGDLILDDLVVDGIEGISVLDHLGEVKLNNVHSRNSWYDGLFIANRFDRFNQSPELLKFGLENNTINISNSSFNNNGSNGLTIESPASVELSGVQANYNGLNGAQINTQWFWWGSSDKDYLQGAPSFSSVVVKNSEFNGNGFYSNVSNKTQLNQNSGVGNGLFIISDLIYLRGVSASMNANNGAVLISGGLVASEPNSQTDPKIQIVCSRFNHNGGYGITGWTDGDIKHVAVKTHGNGENGVAYDFYNSYSENTSYICHKQNQNAVYKGTLIPCADQGLTLQLENKDLARFTGFCDHYGQLVAVTPGSLPGPAPDGTQFGSALKAAAYLNGSFVEVLPAGGRIQVEFFVPEELQDKELVILYWDSALKAWIELPTSGSEGDFSPSDPAKQVLSGAAELENGHYGASVNFSGIFMLVAK